MKSSHINMVTSTIAVTEDLLAVLCILQDNDLDNNDITKVIKICNIINPKISKAREELEDIGI